MSLTDLPAGWKVETLTQGGNIHASVAPGESVTTVWLVTPPAGAPQDPVELGMQAEYQLDCTELKVTGWVQAKIADRAFVPLGSATATASSIQPGGGGEGLAQYAIDGDPGTIWSTSWTASPFPHWIQLDLGGEYTVDGLGYLARTSGGMNGRIKEYKISVSLDGATWTEKSSGSYVAEDSKFQVSDFAEPATARYVRLEALSSHNGLGYATAAELRVFGSGPAETGFVPATRIPDTAGCEVPSPVIELSLSTVERGGSVQVTGHNLPNSEIEIGIESVYQVLAPATPVNGEISESVTIPADIDPGTHSIEVRQGGAILAQASITVTAPGQVTPPPPPATASPSPSPTAPTTASPSPTAPGSTRSANLSDTGFSGHGPLVVGVLALVIAGGLMALSIARRRRKG